MGVDPGCTGGLAIINDDQLITTAMQSLDGVINLKWLTEFLKEHRESFDHAYIEEVHAIFGSSAGSTFSFGRTCGHIEGVLSALSIPITFVRPQVWQKEFGIVKTKAKMTTKEKKERCVLAVQRLYPDLDLRESMRASVPHLGIVDSLLIAEWGRRQK